MTFKLTHAGLELSSISIMKTNYSHNYYICVTSATLTILFFKSPKLKIYVEK